MARVIFLCIGLLTLPTNLAQIIPFLKRKYPAPTSLYWGSLLINIGIAFVIAAVDVIIDNFEENLAESIIYSISAIAFYVIGLLLTFTHCCCDNYGKDGGYGEAFELEDELERDFDDYDTMTRKIAGNRSFPPYIGVIGEAYHEGIKDDSYYDSDGNYHYQTKIERKATYHTGYQLIYKSWQEEGNPIFLEDNISVIHGRIFTSYKFDDEAIAILNQFRQQAYNDCKPHDSFVSVNNNFYVPGFYDRINGTTIQDGKIPCVAKCIPTIGGRILVTFLKFIGYSTLVYSVWESKGKRMIMTVVKNVSMKDTNNGGLRCRSTEVDNYAYKTTFLGKRLDTKHITVRNLQPNYNDNNNINNNNNNDNNIKNVNNTNILTITNAISEFNGDGGFNLNQDE